MGISYLFADCGMCKSEAAKTIESVKTENAGVVTSWSIKLLAAGAPCITRRHRFSSDSYADPAQSGQGFISAAPGIEILMRHCSRFVGAAFAYRVARPTLGWRQSVGGSVRAGKREAVGQAWAPTPATREAGEPSY